MSDSPESTDKKVLLFYCRDCEATFESEPDGTGYEQSPCPTCGDICMTVRFEQEEKERHRNEASLLSFIGKLTGMFSVQEHGASDGAIEVGEQEKDEPRSIPDPTTVGTFDNLAEANTCCALIDHFGIEAQIVQVDGTNPFVPNAADVVVLQVSSSDTERARQIVDEYQSVKEKGRTVPTQDGRITFECEECGADITFPAHRQGGVEVCPHCGRYVDVPE